jgi:peptidoglycan biosynthesis protein MviN/MurJ (putative lipid II flippase)
LADPNHAAIVKGMLAVAAFVFVGKAASAVKEMAVAYRYGLGPEVDAYQLLYTLISWPLGVWSSVLTAVLVPLAIRMRDYPGELARFRAELLGVAILAGIGLALLGWLGMHTMLLLGHSGLPAVSARLAGAALPGLILLLPLGMLTALHSAWMLSAGRHVNTLLDCIPTLFIAGLVLAAPGGGMQPLVWGTVAGCAAHLLALMMPMARRGELNMPRIALASPQWVLFWQGFGIMLAGQALMSLTVVIDQFYAVGLGTGAIATLGYANRILSLILSLAAVAVSRATLPVFSQVQTQGAAHFRAVARRWACLMFAMGVLAMLASHALAPWVVHLLFERGQFSAADTVAVARVLRYGLPQMPFYFSSMVLVSYALSQRRYTLVFCSGLIGCAGKIAGNLLLVPHLGVNGIALGTMLVYALNALFFWLALIAREPRAGQATGGHASVFKRWFK